MRVDPAGSPVWFAQRLKEAGATVVAGPDPCLLPKAKKNSVEQQGTRDAHARDAVAMCRFLHWLSEIGPPNRETEMSAANRLLACREAIDGFRGESFPAISGAGEHGAIIHYRVTDETNRADPAERGLSHRFGRAIYSTARPTSRARSGPVRARRRRDMRARDARAERPYRDRHAGVSGGRRRRAYRLRSRAARCGRSGIDYDHGTGHGVGSYLSVHEGPVSISRLARPVPIGAGMILSNEPGYYLPGQYGIRMENLLLVQPAELPGATRPFLRFETLTLAPFDRNLIDAALLDAWELEWLNAYHARVLREVGPHVEARRTLADQRRARGSADVSSVHDRNDERDDRFGRAAAAARAGADIPRTRTSGAGGMPDLGRPADRSSPRGTELPAAGDRRQEGSVR